MGGSLETIGFIRDTMAKDRVFINCMKVHFSTKATEFTSAKELMSIAVKNGRYPDIKELLQKHPQDAGEVLKERFLADPSRFQAMGAELGYLFKHLEMSDSELLDLVVKARCIPYAQWAIAHGAQVTQDHYMIVLNCHGCFESIYQRHVPLRLPGVTSRDAARFGFSNVKFILRAIRLPFQERKVLARLYYGGPEFFW